MKFSVVLSNFNGSHFIGETITSVLDQTNQDFEFIIIDDGSTDESARIIKNFAQKQASICPVFNKTNLGQGARFNQGVSMASGSIIAFIDSDDIWMPRKLEYLSSFIELSGSAAMYQHNLFLLEEGLKTTKFFRSHLSTGDVYSDVFARRRIPIFTPTTGLAFPKKILEKVLPIPSVFRTCADGYLTRTTMCYGPIASCQNAWGFYRVHSNNNVLNSPSHSPETYVTHLLTPSLNSFYESKNIELRFPSLRSLFLPYPRVTLKKANQNSEVDPQDIPSTSSFFINFKKRWLAMLMAYLHFFAHLPAYNYYTRIRGLFERPLGPIWRFLKKLTRGST